MRGRALVNYRTQGFRDKKSRLSSRKVSCYTCCILCIPSIPFVSALCWELTQTLRGGWSWFVGSMLRYNWQWGHWKEALCRCHAMAEPSLWPCPLERIPLTNHSFTVPGWEPGCGAHTLSVQNWPLPSHLVVFHNFAPFGFFLKPAFIPLGFI